MNQFDSDCTWSILEDRLRCTRCHAEFPPTNPVTGLLSYALPNKVRLNPRLAHNKCSVSCPKNGPGDCLRRAIVRLVGQRPSGNCDCAKRIAKMNAWGVAKCRERISIIVGWLKKEARRRDWWKFIVALPGSGMFIEKLVRDAIDESERLSKEMSESHE